MNPWQFLQTASDGFIMLPQAVTAPDAIFELASMVMAVAVWRMRRAAFLCRDTGRDRQ